jgi:hypothetical protein
MGAKSFTFRLPALHALDNALHSKATKVFDPIASVDPIKVSALIRYCSRKAHHAITNKQNYFLFDSICINYSWISGMAYKMFPRERKVGRWFTATRNWFFFRITTQILWISFRFCFVDCDWLLFIIVNVKVLGHFQVVMQSNAFYKTRSALIHSIFKSVVNTFALVT